MAKKAAKAEEIFFYFFFVSGTALVGVRQASSSNTQRVAAWWLRFAAYSDQRSCDGLMKTAGDNYCRYYCYENLLICACRPNRRMTMARLVCFVGVILAAA
jgi:hypothetical protein